MSSFTKWILGIIILAILTGIYSFFSPFSAKQRSIEMGESIQSALSSGGFDFAEVSMSGNVATLTGEAKSAASKSAALELAEKTPCKTCKKKDRLWHNVVDEMTVEKAPELPLQSPYTFEAVKAEDGAVVINGYVPSEDDRKRIIAEADNLYGANYTDNKVRIARGAPNREWTIVALGGLKTLGSLNRGQLAMTDNEFVITGMANDIDIRNSANSYATGLPADYNGSANIDLPEVQTEDVCQNLIDEVKGNSRVNFATSSAEIQGTESFDLLNKLSAVVRQCSAFNIQVAGHTDSQGGAEQNQWLSEARAKTVVDYLVSNNIDAERVSHIGFGETRPIASNQTREGRAENRRIDFTVSKAN